MRFRFFLTQLLLIPLLACNKNSKSNAESVHYMNEQVLNPTLDLKPNILWIVAEDMSPNIPAFGDSTVVTPHLNQLAKEGVCYDNFFSPHPLCSPAWASNIMGMYANSIGANHVRTNPWMLKTFRKVSLWKLYPFLKKIYPMDTTKSVGLLRCVHPKRHNNFAVPKKFIISSLIRNTSLKSSRPSA